MQTLSQFRYTDPSTKQQTQTYLFQQELVYGVKLKYFNKHNNSTQLVICYLHQKYLNLIVFINPFGHRKLYDLKKLRILKNNTKYQSIYNLKNQIVLYDGFTQQILLFPDSDSKNHFFNQMKNLIYRYRQNISQKQSYAIEWFIQADKDFNEILSYQQMREVLQKLKIKPDNIQIQRILEGIIKSNVRFFDEKIKKASLLKMPQFQTFTCLLFCKPQLKFVYQKYIKISKKHTVYSSFLIPTMNRLQFEIFLKAQQFQTSQNSKSISSTLFNSKSNEGNLQSKQEISFYQFCCYIISANNYIFGTQSFNNKILDKQDYPLNYYYCFSSHNTYLSGNQLTSDSKVQRYVQDLQDGIRCVQLDIYDDKDVPIIKHGYTATSPVFFEDVIKAIANWCNQNYNHTPIILSFQNHCGVENQNRMSRILKQNFTDQRTKQSKILQVSVNQVIYPTLAQLKNKVIIKCTGKLQNIIHKNDQLVIQQEQQYNSLNLQRRNTLQRRISLPKKFSIQQKEIKSFRNKKIQFDKTIKLYQQAKLGFQLNKKYFYTTLFPKNITPKKKISPKLLQITSMLSSGHLGDNNCWESISLSQNTFSNTIKKQKTKLLKHCQTSWVRIYPAGKRIDSSNYNPLPMLEVGAQIVALNTQYKDIYTQILYSFFMKHRKQIGYKLKPKNLRGQQQTESTMIILKIKIISCHFITFNEFSHQIPQVQVNIAFIGSTEDMVLNRSSGQFLPYTQIIQDNAYNPVFLKSIQFSCQIKNPYFAFICFQIKNCGRCAVPVKFIRRGYRVVPIYDDLLQQKGSYILVKVTID